MCISPYKLLCASGNDALCDKCGERCNGADAGQWIWTYFFEQRWWCNKCACLPLKHPALSLVNPPSSTLIDVKKDGGFDEIKTIDVEELRAKREALRGEIKTMDDRSSLFQMKTMGWNTNWNKHTIEYSELLSGGPPRDGIPPIDKPKFVDVKQAQTWIGEKEPVVFVNINGKVKAYPIQVLIWHEIVNDTLGGKNISVTFCPLCNSTIVFDRNIDGKVYDFGTSGLLRNSDLVMYDRQSETLWQQFTGEAIVGDMVGITLTMLPSSMISFKDYYTQYPKGKILSKDTGHVRSYGNNPYVGYDDIDSSPFLYQNPTDPRLKPMARVVTISDDGKSKAYSYKILKAKKVINDTFAKKDIVVFHKSGTTSALDGSSIAYSKDVGATAVFSAKIDNRVLDFVYDKSKGIVDITTKSSWNIFGQAVSGEYKGKQLKQLVSADHFWFSWAAFRPNTLVYK